MNLLRWLLLATVIFSLTPVKGFTQECPALLSHTMPKLHSSESVNLCETFKGKPVLIVNTASHCGFTGQFRDLQALYETHNKKGLEILGVPSNSFRQEAKSAAETAKICYRNYGVTFTMTSAQAVTGPNAHPLFQELRKQSGKEPQWNFHKYLVNEQGEVVNSFRSHVKPSDPEILRAIEALL